MLVLGGQVYPSVLDDEPEWLYWLLAVVSALFFCASIIIHELAHSAVARRAGLPVKSITLFMLGGVSEIGREAKRPLVEFTMAIVGPLSSILLAGVFLAVAFVPGVRDGRSSVMWEWLFLMNLALGIVNMAPGFPMDGGRVLRAALWGATGNFNRATQWASYAGRGLGYALIGAGLLVFVGTIPLEWLTGLWFVLVGLFLENAARQSWENIGVLEALRNHKAREIMRTWLPQISQDAMVLEAVARHFDVQFGLCAFAVDDDERAVGMLTAAELHGLPKERWADTPIRDRMIPAATLPSVSPDTDLAAVIELMEQHELSQLPVVEDGRLTAYIQRGRIAVILHNELHVEKSAQAEK